MTRDHVTYLVVITLLGAIGIWVARNTYWDETRIPMPPQGEAATNPYYSVQHLTKRLDIRSSFVLSMDSQPPLEGVLLLDSFQSDMTHTHIDKVMAWVDAGGRLIINDTMLRADPKVQDWSQIHLGIRSVPRDGVKEKTNSGTPFTVHDPDDDCSPLEVARDGQVTDERLTLCIPPGEFGWVSKSKPAWSLANQFGLQILRVNVGKGSVTVIPRYYLIANKNLLRKDHAEIFITAANLARGDRLYIVNEGKAEKLLPLLWRLAAPALVFFGIAIVCLIWREIPRFGPPLPAPALVRRSLAEQIRANAAFAWRTRKLSALRAAVRRALDETARKRIAAFSGLDIRRRANAIAASTGTDAKNLSSAMTEAAAANPQVQRAAISLLEQTRRILNARTKKIQPGRL